MYVSLVVSPLQSLNFFDPYFGLGSFDPYSGLGSFDLYSGLGSFDPCSGLGSSGGDKFVACLIVACCWSYTMPLGRNSAAAVFCRAARPHVLVFCCILWPVASQRRRGSGACKGRWSFCPEGGDAVDVISLGPPLSGQYNPPTTTMTVGVKSRNRRIRFEEPLLFARRTSVVGGTALSRWAECAPRTILADLADKGVSLQPMQRLCILDYMYRNFFLFVFGTTSLASGWTKREPTAATHPRENVFPAQQPLE